MIGEVDTGVLERLREWEKTGSELPGWMRPYRELLQIQSEVKPRAVPKPDLTEGLVRDRLCEGRPLLPFADFSPDWDEVQAVLERIAAWLGNDSGATQEEAAALRLIARDQPLLRKAAAAWYEGNQLTAFAAARSIDGDLLASALSAALKPFLLAYSQSLAPAIDQGLWRRRYCPVCGGKPDLAYLDKDTGARWLLCCRCDAEWLFQRLECPYCGTQEHGALAYFTDERKPSYRLYVCEQCRAYIKAIDLRRVDSEVYLPLQRLVTLDMDRLGQERGYRPGWAA